VGGIASGAMASFTHSAARVRRVKNLQFSVLSPSEIVSGTYHPSLSVVLWSHSLTKCLLALVNFSAGNVGDAESYCEPEGYSGRHHEL
jgi:hypothetical protein